MGSDVTILVKDFETKKKIMTLVCQRMSYEGDMAGSGAAMDPLFWVVHGAVERVFQRVMLEGVFTGSGCNTPSDTLSNSSSDTSSDTPSDTICSNIS